MNRNHDLTGMVRDLLVPAKRDLENPDQGIEDIGRREAIDRGDEMPTQVPKTFMNFTTKLF